MSSENVSVHLTVNSPNNCSLEGPLVLPPHFLLLLWGEIVLDVERLPDFLRRLALDHVGHRHASEVQQGLDVEVVGSKDELEQRGLVHIGEFGVEHLDVFLTGVVLLAGLGVELAVLDDHCEDLCVDVGNGHLLARPQICAIKKFGWRSFAALKPRRRAVSHRVWLCHSPSIMFFMVRLSLTTSASTSNCCPSELRRTICNFKVRVSATRF